MGSEFKLCNSMTRDADSLIAWAEAVALGDQASGPDGMPFRQRAAQHRSDLVRGEAGKLEEVQDLTIHAGEAVQHGLYVEPALRPGPYAACDETRRWPGYGRPYKASFG